MARWLWRDGNFENRTVCIKDDLGFSFSEKTWNDLSWSAAYLCGSDPQNPKASPLFADLTGLGPFVHQFGGAELLRDENRRFAERARSHGVDIASEEWPDMFHVWQFAAPILPEANAAVQRLADHVSARLGP